jgi:uncharacterized membrane protein YeiH
VYLVLQKLSMPRTFAISAGVLVILGMRVLAVVWGAHLPRLHALS